MPTFIAYYRSRELLLEAEDLEAAAAKVEALGGPRAVDLLECADIAEVYDAAIISAAAQAGDGLLVRPIWARRLHYEPLERPIDTL
jgi:hypothetical protein